MSYSNPRWYGVGNPQAFTDAFQKSFNTQYTNAIEYYEAKSKDLEEYNDSLELKAERQRQAILKSKNVTADMIKQAEQAAQDFLKESRTVSEDTDVFGAPKLIKKTKAEIDTASSAFSASAKTAGDIADIVYSEKIDLEKDLDKGGLYYDHLLKVKRALDNGNYEFKYDKDNKYSFKVKTEDGKVLDQDDLRMIIAGNDPKARKRIDEAWDETVVRVYGSTMTDLNNAITAGYASRDRDGKEIYQEEYIDKMLDDTVANMSNKTKDEFYNNELDSISDEATKAKILEQSGGKLLIDTAQEIDTKNKNNNSKEALSMLLDIPLNNVSERKRLIKEVLGEARFNEMSMEDKNNIDEALSVYRSTAVREGLKKELKAKGLKSKYIAPTRPTGRTYSGRLNNDTSDKPSKLSIGDQNVLTKLWNYTGENLKYIPGSKKDKTGGEVISLDETKSFSRGKIKASGRFQDVEGVEQRPGSEKLNIYYGQQGRSKEVDRKDPDSVFFAFKDLAVGKVNEKDFNKIMLKEFSTNDGLSRLGNNGMSKWVDWLTSLGQKNMLIDYLVNQEVKGISLKSSTVGTWENFYKENEEVINAKLKEPQNQRAIDDRLITQAQVAQNANK